MLQEKETYTPEDITKIVDNFYYYTENCESEEPEGLLLSLKGLTSLPYNIRKALLRRDHVEVESSLVKRLKEKIEPLLNKDSK